MVEGPGRDLHADPPRAADSDCAPDDPTSVRKAQGSSPGGSPATGDVPGGLTQAADAAHPTALPTHAIAGYSLVREVHRGGQGVVYQALQHSTRRHVAIKVMREGPFASEAERARFDREVQLLAALNHPNIVTIHDCGHAAGCAYFVMDYISGRALDEWCAGDGGRERSIGEKLGVFCRICEAVHAAHVRGIVHRDLKPGNIRVDYDGQPHVLDFGLAKMNLAETTDGTTVPPFTITGHFVGSVPWASPEQAEAQPGRIDSRSDVYSLGVVLYHMLTGRFPYDVTGSMPDVLEHIRHTPPLPLRVVRRELDRELETIVLTCLHKDRERRYANAGALAADLARYQAGEPIAARRDSFGYLLSNRTRKVLREHPTALLALILAAGMVLTLVWPGKPLVYSWKGANQLFEQGALHQLARRVGTLDHVRVIAADANTDLQALAAAAGIDPLVLQNDPRALRAVHGVLLESLARADPAVVGFDISFAGDSVYDAAFVRGVKALRENPRRPCTVVIGEKTWSFAEGRASTSAAISEVTQWGATPSMVGGPIWNVFLSARRAQEVPVPSLALRMYAASRQPTHEINLELSQMNSTVQVIYAKHTAGPQSPRLAGQPTDLVRATEVQRQAADSPAYGLKAGDRLANFRVPVLARETLGAATADYEDVLRASEEELRRDFGGKCVLICNWRTGPLAVQLTKTRKEHGSYIHATALELLSRGTGVRVLTPPYTLLWTGVIGLLGLAVGVHFERRLTARIACLSLLSVALAAACLIAALRYGVLYHPFIAILALVIPAELSAATRRLRRV